MACGVQRRLVPDLIHEFSPLRPLMRISAVPEGVDEKAVTRFTS